MGQYRHQTAYRPILGRWHDTAYWGLLLLACAVLLLMNVLTPYKEDDMGFTLIDGVWTRVNSITDALQSYCNHLTNTNHRLADLFPTLFAGLLGKGVFNLCNTLMFGLLAHLLSLLCAHRRSVSVLAFFLAVVGTCFPVPGETMLWMSGSCNYLWSIALSLLFIYYLQHQQGSSMSTVQGVLLFLGGVVAGGFNEATSFGFFAGLILYYTFNRKQLDRRALIAMAGYLIGILFIVSSPAAWSRASDGELIINLPIGQLFSTRFHIFTEKAWRFYLPVAALLVGIVALMMRLGRAAKQNVWAYIFIGLTLVMFALGLMHERAYSPWVTVAFIIVAIGLETILSRTKSLRAAFTLLSVALAVFTFGRGIKVMSEYKTFNDAVIAEIQAAPEQAVLLERQFQGYSRFIKPMNYQSDHFFAHEIIYRAYFDKQNVQFVSDSVHVRIREGRLLDGAEPLPTMSDHPNVLGTAYVFPDQSYMVVTLLTDTLPATFQTARYIPTATSPSQERQRQTYGIQLDYMPAGFYPIEYQHSRYLVCQRPDPSVDRMVFPMDITSHPVEVSLTLK